MWVDDAGVMHTVAIPEPRRLVPPALLHALASLSVDDRDELRERLDDMYDELSDVLAPGTGEVALALDETEVDWTLDGTGALAVEAMVRRVEPLWRLDVLLVVQDLLDLLDDE